MNEHRIMSKHLVLFSLAMIEAAAAGIHRTFASMVNIAHNPHWGRIMESSGEDVYLGSQIGAARVRNF